MSDHIAHNEIKMGSEKGFGIVFAVVAALATGYLYYHGSANYVYTAIAAGVFLFLAYVAPQVLKPLNFIWFKFGMLLGAIVSPIVMSLLYFLVFTPFGLIMRCVKKDPMHTKLDKEAESYWIKREKPVGSMKDQF